MARSGSGPGVDTSTKAKWSSVFADDPTGKVYQQLLADMKEWQEKNSKDADRMGNEKAFRYTKNKIIEKLVAKISEQIQAIAALPSADAKTQAPVYLRKIIYTWGFEELGNCDLSCNYAFVCEQRSWGESTLKKILEKSMQALKTEDYKLGFQNDEDEQLAHHILTVMMGKISRRLGSEIYHSNMVTADCFKNNQHRIFRDNSDGNVVVQDRYRTTGRYKIREIRRLVNNILHPKINALGALLGEWNIKDKYIMVKHNKDGVAYKDNVQPHDCLRFLVYREDGSSVNFNFLIDIFRGCENVSRYHIDHQPNTVAMSVLSRNANAAEAGEVKRPAVSATAEASTASRFSVVDKKTESTTNTKPTFFCRFNKGAGPTIDQEYAGIFSDDVRGVVCRQLMEKLAQWSSVPDNITMQEKMVFDGIVGGWREKIVAALNSDAAKKKTLSVVIKEWLAESVEATVLSAISIGNYVVREKHFEKEFRRKKAELYAEVIVPVQERLRDVPRLGT